MPAQFPEVHRVGIKKYHFHVEQHEQNGDKKIFNGNRLPGIAPDLDPAFKILQFIGGFSFRPQVVRRDHDGNDQPDGEYQLEANRQIIRGVIYVGNLQEIELHKRTIGLVRKNTSAGAIININVQYL